MSETLDELFEAAASLPASEQEPWLRAHCNDEHLVNRVLALLHADSKATGFLELPPIEAMADAAGELADEIARGRPERVGPYEIERLLGTGGMGEVFLARRCGGDFEQRVAIKLLRGLPTRELTDRFSRERRVLASLAHPNIAALIDGGETETGTPYLVMPFVEGEPIDVFCRSRNLGARELIELAIPVLVAVGHAHRRLVVHRDIKPANVLVDAEGRPMVLDFGIAKILGNAGSNVTGTGRQLLTPMYASPEQVRDEPISTSTDVFSLGVLLYELCAGVHPWGSDHPSPLELAKRICEMDPPTPSSVRASSMTDARQSQRALWADLDAVIMNALRKEAERRYASVDRFADDLRRALDGRTVTARPDTITYRASKFIGRHRAAVGAIAFAATALVAGTAISVWQAHRAEAASSRYLEQLAFTQTRNHQLRELATTLIFEVYDSVATLDGANPARLALVENGVAYLDELSLQLEDDPSLAIDLVRGYARLADVQALRTIGSMGDTAGALQSSTKALDVARRLQAMPDAPADAPMLLATAHRVRGDLLRAIGDHEQSIAAYAAGRRAAQDAIDRLPGQARPYRFAISLALQQGAAERRIGRPRDALVSYAAARTAIDTAIELDPEDTDTRRNLTILLRREGDLLLAEGREADAQAKYEEGAGVLRVLMQTEPNNRQYESDLSIQIERLGDCAMRRGDPTSALERYEAAHKLAKDESDRNPGDLLSLSRLSIAIEKLADAQHAIGNIEQAADLAAESAAMTAEAAAQDPLNHGLHLDSLFTRGKAARMAIDAGRDSAAELMAVADAANELSIKAPRDSYPASIELDALATLMSVDPSANARLARSLARLRREFGEQAWYEAAVATLERSTPLADQPASDPDS